MQDYLIQFFQWLATVDVRILQAIPLVICGLLLCSAVWVVYEAICSVHVCFYLRGLLLTGGSPACWAKVTLKNKRGKVPTLQFRLWDRKEFYVVFDGGHGEITYRKPTKGHYYHLEMVRLPKNTRVVTPVMDNRPYRINVVAKVCPADVQLDYDYVVTTGNRRTV